VLLAAFVVKAPWVQGVVATFLVKGERCDEWTVSGPAGAGEAPASVVVR
jgi:hypothetical protein